MFSMRILLKEQAKYTYTHKYTVNEEKPYGACDSDYGAILETLPSPVLTFWKWLP